MRFALDENGARVFIDCAIREGKYFCPVCHEEVIQRRGSIYAHHFAHFPNMACIDHWHYEEKSRWHVSWQDQFPKENQEIIMQFEGKTHIADVYLPEHKTVIEFQHSPLSLEEFEDRNSFYTKLGNKIVWVFDMREEFQDERIQSLKGSEEKFRYLNPKRLFSNLDIKNQEVTIFFQSEGKEECQDVVLHLVKWISPRGISFFCSERMNKVEFFDIVEDKEKTVSIEINKYSVLYYYNKENPNAMILLNRKTDDRYMFVQNPLEQIQKYHTVYARKENSFGEFPKDSVIVKDWNEPIWKPVWFKSGDKKEEINRNSKTISYTMKRRK